MSKRRDVVVIGAGPAGATAAGLLAQRGHDVLLLERDTFPRDHIGESLLPAELPVFEALGFDPGGAAVPKAGADFLDERTGQLARFLFRDALPPAPGAAVQVERAGFDHRLAEHVRGLGVELRYGVRARAVHTDADEARVELEGGDTLHARFVVDATGRDRLMCRQLRAFERIDGLGVAAIWARFDGLRDEAVAELAVTGNITILILDKGWGWVIPLPNARLSVGFVSAERGVVSDGWFEERYAASPMLQRLTAGARRGPLERVGDYSFKNTRASGLRYGCIGDASAFLDPVFSSGVAFAMMGATELAQVLGAALSEGREHDPELLTGVEQKMQQAYDVFGALIHSFYHTNLVQNLFFYDDPDPTLRAGLISVLAGDVWRDDNAFQNMILRSARRLERRQSLRRPAS